MPEGKICTWTVDLMWIRLLEFGNDVYESFIEFVGIIFLFYGFGMNCYDFSFHFMIFVQRLIDGVVGDTRLVRIKSGFHGIEVEPVSSLRTLIFLWDP